MLSSNGFFILLDLPTYPDLGMGFGPVLGAILEKSQSSEEFSEWSTAILTGANESDFITFPELILKFAVNTIRPEETPTIPS